MIPYWTFCISVDLWNSGLRLRRRRKMARIPGMRQSENLCLWLIYHRVHHALLTEDSQNCSRVSGTWRRFWPQSSLCGYEGKQQGNIGV
jgi:hypothetical protein